MESITVMLLGVYLKNKQKEIWRIGFMGRATEFIHFINQKIKPKPRDIMFDYTHMTLNDEIDKIRKRTTGKVKTNG